MDNILIFCNILNILGHPFRESPEKAQHKDQQNRNRSHELDQIVDCRIEHSPALDGTGIRQFVEEILLLYLPAGENREQQGSEDHKVVRAELVTEIEEAVAKDSERGERTEGEGAENSQNAGEQEYSQSGLSP